jgi:signal transduction histidine kinase
VTPGPVPERTLRAISAIRDATRSPATDSWSPTFLNLTDLLLPRAADRSYTPEELRSARLIATSVSLTIPPAILIAIVYPFFGGSILVSGAFFLAAAYTLITLLRLHTGLAPQQAGLHWIGSLVFATTALTLATNGANSSPATALAVFPLLALAICTPRAAAWTLYWCCVILAGLGVVGAFGLVGGETTPLTHAGYGIGLVVGAICSFVVAKMVRLTRSLAGQDVASINDSLACEVREHRDTRQRLRNTHQELMAAARRAGAAEVATGVLHNVGNGLNAVTVGAALVDERLHGMRLERIGRLAIKLESNTNIDPRLGAFAHAVFRSLEEEREATLTELRTLRQSVEHVAATVATQQRWAHKAGVTEVVDVPDMVNEVLGMIGLGKHHDIEVTLDIPDLPPIITDRHRIIQIVTNLLTNAKDAVQHNVETLRRIRVAVRLDSMDSLKISVTDTGSGIDPNNIERVFQHGFTTKSTGHGFGLHASALTARELDGELNAYSPGRGQGATFVLCLPVTMATQF